MATLDAPEFTGLYPSPLAGAFQVVRLSPEAGPNSGASRRTRFKERKIAPDQHHDGAWWSGPVERIDPRRNLEARALLSGHIDEGRFDARACTLTIRRAFWGCKCRPRAGNAALEAIRAQRRHCYEVHGLG